MYDDTDEDDFLCDDYDGLLGPAGPFVALVCASALALVPVWYTLSVAYKALKGAL